MTCCKNSQPCVEADDLSSISCISRLFPLEANAQAEKDGGGERFENEFDGSKKKEAYSIQTTFRRSEGNDGSRPSTLPTELILPLEWCNHRSSNHPSLSTTTTTSSSWCKIPRLRQYPPVLRALFVVCFVCIICAIGLIAYAVVVEARGGSQSSAVRNFDIGDWGKGDSSSTSTDPTTLPHSSGSDIFVEGDSSGGGPVPSPTSTQSPTTVGGMSPVFYTTATPQQLPQTNMIKKKQMRMNKDKDTLKEGKDNKDVTDKGDKDDDRRNRRRQRRRVREMKPSMYPDRRDSWW